MKLHDFAMNMPAQTSAPKAHRPGEHRNYVVGLCFDTDMKHVVLLKKRTGPACVIGKWNGVGGKIEHLETPSIAMRREFMEEAGVDIPEELWTQFCVYETPNYNIHFFYCCSSLADCAHTRTSEPVDLFTVERARDNPYVMENIRWMVPFLCDPHLAHKILPPMKAHR